MRRLPGDPPPSEVVERMLRVDHAGEYGAKRIYQGQLAVLAGSTAEPALRHMADQEDRHLRYFEEAVADRRVRPSLFLPLWHVAAFALGAATAALGKEAAMACTVAVEETIEEHYLGQLETLGDGEPELSEAIAGFLEEEIEHRDHALAAGAERAPAYELLYRAVGGASKLAIRLSTRL